MDNINRTPTEILNDILNRIDGVDTRPSSSTYQAVSAVAYEIRNLELFLNYSLNQSFIGTATGEFLTNLAKQFNYVREEKQNAVVKGEIITQVPVPIGTRFASVGLTNSIIYEVIEKDTQNPNIYYLRADKINNEVNYYLGDLAMIDYLNNLESAKIIEIVTPAKEEEDDEEFRKRIQSNLIGGATDGNVAQYKKWLSEINGIGKFKILPLWDGVNTVKCTILNEINKKASNELINEVQTKLDPNSTGLGEGLAPIGAIVTVDTAEELEIDIELEVVYKQGKTSAPTLTDDLNKFFSDIAFNRSVCAYLQVASVISTNPDIDYIVNLTINNDKIDIPIPDDKIPVLGVLNVN